jgi:phosphoribosylaminoimidazole-succinocarboxamide synthase
MAVIPPSVATTEFHDCLLAAGLTLVHRGKVRDTYSLPESELWLVVATNRISIFDIVLSTLVPGKGEVLTALTVFWLTQILRDLPHHLVAYGKGIDDHLPPAARDIVQLHKCALIVHRLPMVSVECIVRGYLTGSGWASYQKQGQICGIVLPAGLHDGSKLVPPLFTPTTKEVAGHDQPLDMAGVLQRYGPGLGDLSITCYRRLADYAAGRGVIVADTKFEFGRDGDLFVLADEVGTPDSSRFWDRSEWEEARQLSKSPTAWDKQLVRDWGITVDVHKRDPAVAEDVAFVHQLTVPPAVVDETTHRYRTIFERLTGYSLTDFQRKSLRVYV